MLSRNFLKNIHAENQSIESFIGAKINQKNKVYCHVVIPTNYRRGI